MFSLGPPGPGGKIPAPGKPCLGVGRTGPPGGMEEGGGPNAPLLEEDGTATALPGAPTESIGLGWRSRPPV